MGRLKADIEKALTIIRIVIYLRVSDKKQLEDKVEDSIESQEVTCRDFASRLSVHGEQIIIVEVIHDDGKTARHDKRQGIERLRELIRQRAVDVILVNRLDRIFRNAELGSGFDRLTQENGVRIVSVHEPSGTDTAAEKLVRNIFWSFAQFTTDKISEDVRRSIRTRAGKGLTNGGTPKPGYRQEHGRLIVVKEDAEVVQEMFRLACLKWTPGKIADELNASGLRTRIHVSRKGNQTGGHRFTGEYVLKRLRDPTYKGVVEFEGNTYEGDFKSIVSEKIWDAAQVALDNRPRKREGTTQQRDRHFNPFKGIIRCGHCDSGMKPTYTKKGDALYHYYICTKHAALKEESTCTIHRVPARMVERAVLQAIGSLGDQPEIIDKVLDTQISGQNSRIRKLRSERSTVRKQLHQLDTEVRSVTEKLLAVAGTVIGEEIKKQSEQLTNQKKDLLAQEVELTQQIEVLEYQHLDAEKVSQGFKHFADAVGTLPESEQRELYRLLFSRILIIEGESILDPGIPSDKRCRMQRRQLTATITLRGAAIQALAVGEAQAKGKAKNLSIPLVIAHSRSKPEESFGVLAPIHKECGSKPAGRPRKRPPKTEHEIHKAIRWKKEMEELGLNESQFAKKLKLSRNAVNAVLQWLKLPTSQQKLLSELCSSAEIRKYSRRWRKQQLGKS